MSQKLRVAVLTGGTSSERDISLISGKEVVKYLNKKKYNVTRYDPAKDLGKIIENKEKIDVVLPILHGPGGEDGQIQGFLKLLNLPYAASGVLSSAIAMNKLISKQLYIQNEILVPKYQILRKNDKRNVGIELPYIVKPILQGSSVGISIVNKRQELENALKLAFSFEDKIMIEEYIKGIEVTAPILGNDKPRALPVIEIAPPEGKFFDRQVKYDGSTQEIIPARISKELTKQVQKIGIKAHLVLGCRGLSRTDMIIAKTQKGRQKAKIYVLETNTIPGMTSESLFPKSARAVGISFEKLLDKLINLALEE